MSSAVKILIGLSILLTISCNNKKQKSTNENDLSNINLLTQKESQTEHMQALLSSEPEKISVDENGCIRIKDYLIIWPFGFKIIDKNNKLTIVDNEGNFVANIGDKVIVSGGECSGCSINYIKKITGTNLNQKCEGIYWIIGGEIRSE